MNRSRATPITPFRLETITLKKLDELCRVSGKSRTQEVRRLILEAFLRENPEKRESATYISDYRSVINRKRRERNAAEAVAKEAAKQKRSKRR
jgi:hypothetical protein